MQQPKPATVVLLLAVVAVVALYVLGVGLGATDRSEGRRGLPVSKEERQAWRERFFKPRPVEVDELEPGPGCQLVGQELRVVVGQPCRVEVADSRAAARTLELVPQASLVAMDFTSKSKPALAVSEDTLAEAKKLDVAKEGATLEVRCIRALTGSTALCRVLLR